MKLVKTSTHRSSVVLSDNEFESLKQPGAELTVIISQKIGDRYQKIDEIAQVDITYALENYKDGYGYYEGKKIVSIRPIKQSRKPRAKKQFCKRGHDTFVCGRHPVSGSCNECAKLHTKKNNLKTMLANAERKLAVPVELQRLNDDCPSQP
jgi:hypothetical protein